MKSIPVDGLVQLGALFGSSGLAVFSVKISSAGLYVAVLTEMSAWASEMGLGSLPWSFSVTVVATGAPPAGEARAAKASTDVAAQAMRHRRGRVIEVLPDFAWLTRMVFDVSPAAPPGRACD